MQQDIYAALRDEILSGALPPLSPLAENSLATRFGISRTPVREALLRLVAEQLAERGPHGIIVKETSPEEILDIYEVRINLEGLAAREAASKHTVLDMAKLVRAQEAMHSLTVNDGRSRAGVNRAFHEQLWVASHNSTLTDVLTRLNAHLIRYPSTTLTRPGRWEEALHEHDEILHAIKAGDGATAERLATLHMGHARDVRLEMYALLESGSGAHTGRG